MRFHSKKAFTLIEMVIVIAVIAILSAVLIPTFSNVIKDAKFKTQYATIQAESEIMMEKIIIALDGEITVDDFCYGNLYFDGSHYYFCIQNGIAVNARYNKEDDLPLEYRDRATHKVRSKRFTKDNYLTSYGASMSLCFHWDMPDEYKNKFTAVTIKLPIEINGVDVYTNPPRDFEYPPPDVAWLSAGEATVTTTSTVQTYDSFMQAYYDCLTENFGNNAEGSCGYVALGMLLSYYDTYLNDDIVPENYDVASEGDEYDMRERRNSPGVLFEDYSGMTDLDGDGTVGDNDDYYAYYESVDEESLHAKLITIGGEMGYYDEDAQLNQAAGLTMSQIEDVFESYLEDVAGLDSSDYTIETVAKTIFNADKARDWTIEQIQAGKPVLLGIGNEAGGGHAVVAYDYDEETDKIYCHFGWGSATTHTTPEDEKFYTYSNAMVITFTDSHSHSDNYKVGDSEYCYCEMEEFSVYSTNPSTVGLQIDLIDSPITTPDSKENEREIS